MDRQAPRHGDVGLEARRQRGVRTGIHIDGDEGARPLDGPPSPDTSAEAERMYYLSRDTKLKGERT